MVILGAAGSIGVESRAKVGGGVMTADHLASLAGGIQLGEHFWVGGSHTGIVHHLAQPDNVVPLHRLGHICGAELCAGRFQPRGGRHTGGNFHPHMDRLPGGFIRHKADALQPEDVGDLVRVHEHAGGAVGDHGAHEFCHGQHA